MHEALKSKSGTILIFEILDVRMNRGARRLIFILGAGASVLLGMPRTIGLRNALCDDTPEGRGESGGK